MFLLHVPAKILRLGLRFGVTSLIDKLLTQLVENGAIHVVVSQKISSLYQSTPNFTTNKWYFSMVQNTYSHGDKRSWENPT